MTVGRDADHGTAESASPEFEAIVEARLKVDPEGITGQTAGGDKKDDDDRD